MLKPNNVYWIGSRSKALLSQMLGEEFLGWLMSDGYHVYCQFKHRLRCWAHLLRKARGLKESLSAEARAFGEITHDLIRPRPSGRAGGARRCGAGAIRTVV
jgi:hypothetical protein